MSSNDLRQEFFEKFSQPDTLEIFEGEEFKAEEVVDLLSGGTEEAWAWVESKLAQAKEEGVREEIEQAKWRFENIVKKTSGRGETGKAYRRGYETAIRDFEPRRYQFSAGMQSEEGAK